MILDSNLFFDPAGTAITSTANSTNVLDMLNARDMGIGEDLKVTVTSNLAFAAAGAATLQIALQGAPDNGSGSPGTWVTYAETDALSKAELNDPTVQNISLVGFDLPERRQGQNPPRFYRLVYTVTTGPFTAGAVQAFVNLSRDQLPQYPSGFTVAN